MTPKLLLFLLLLCVSRAGTPRKKNMVSKLVDDFLENLKREALDLGNVDLGDKIGSLSDMKIAVGDLPRKKVDGTGPYGVVLEATFQEVLVTGYYDIRHLDIPGLFPVFGKGNLFLRMESIDLEFDLKVRQNLETDKFDVAIPKFKVSLGKTEVKLENFMNDSHLADFLNRLIAALIPDLVSVFQDKFIESMKPLVEFFVNEVIACIKKELLTGKLTECIRNITKVDRVAWDDSLPLPVELTKLDHHHHHHHHHHH